ncbi:EXS family-domain-containing protein, partial [Cyathus striatus]
LFRNSRYWLLRNFVRLLLSGTRRVEFADFWMGDQFCSLVFTLSNLYLIGCVYNRGFDENWRKCGASSSYWPVIFILAVLPLIVRLVQSIKRYADSKLITHLINGGKYGSGIISYFFYYMWRHQGINHRGALFVLWCLFNANYSIYASCWDLFMDWSLLRVHTRYPFLREEVVYTNHIPLYYFAIISNVLLRFMWVIYIPQGGPNIQLRTFIAAVFEMLRRWQWNFYRLENEHLGNMDQYRVTREVPLPYSFDDASHEEDGDDDGDDAHLKRR